MKKEWNQNLAGNEAHYTSSMKCLVKNMLYSKLHCQKGFYLVNFSYQILHKGESTILLSCSTKWRVVRLCSRYLNIHLQKRIWSLSTNLWMLDQEKQREAERGREREGEREGGKV